jgi:hypothetical protein
MMNFRQPPDAIMMIRPATFSFNAATASTNSFQRPGEMGVTSIYHSAIAEFDRMIELLLAHEIDVRVFDDQGEVSKPDAIFPNNWISFHEDGKVILYPMMAENRRAERRNDIIEKLSESFLISEVIDLSSEETTGHYLEGTGSLVFDHAHRVLFACRSARTSEKLVNNIAERLKYKPIVFDAVDHNGSAIYHTNVMMSIAEKFAVVCLDSVKNDRDQDVILESLADSGHQVIAISYEQMNAFAGNLLEVRDQNGSIVVVISEAAVRTLLPGQINSISRFADLLTISIPTIEKCGGGSVRCMIAGIHLAKRKNTT